MRRALWVGLALVLAGCQSPAETTVSTPTASDRQPAVSTAPIRPAAGPQPILTVTDYSTGGSCADQGLSVPAFVAYDDGSVLMTTPMASYCERLPMVTAGRIDTIALRAEVERYLASPEARADLNPACQCSGGHVVADGGGTEIHYIDRDLIEHSKRAYALDDLVRTAGDASAATAFRALVNFARQQVTGARSWAPPSIKLIKAPDAVPLALQTRPWPVPATAAVRNLAAGPESTCLVVTGSTVPKILAAQAAHPAGGYWTINGRKSALAIGLVLPGLTVCS